MTAETVEAKWRRLPRRTKRDLGILPWQLLDQLREMREDGADLDAMSHEEIAQALMAQCQADHPEGWIQDIDWQAVREFIEWLVPFLIQIINLFA